MQAMFTEKFGRYEEKSQELQQKEPYPYATNL
jgi:hypothetical protein